MKPLIYNKYIKLIITTHLVIHIKLNKYVLSNKSDKPSLSKKHNMQMR